MVEYLEKNESLNIVFKAGTQYVRADDILPSGHVLPYKLETVSSYEIRDDILVVRFRTFYMDKEHEGINHVGKFSMDNITRVFTTKKPSLVG